MYYFLKEAQQLSLKFDRFFCTSGESNSSPQLSPVVTTAPQYQVRALGPGEWHLKKIGSPSFEIFRNIHQAYKLFTPHDVART